MGFLNRPVTGDQLRTSRHILLQCYCLYLLALGVCAPVVANDFIAPIIQITEEVSPGDDGTELNVFKVTIRDSQKLISANLLFREYGSTGDYRYVPLVEGDTRYLRTATIEKGDVLSKDIEIYVEVLDARGNRSQFPPAENPLQLSVLHHEVPKGFPSKPTHWVGIALGAAAVLALIAEASGGESSGSSSPTLTITAPVPQ